MPLDGYKAFHGIRPEMRALITGGMGHVGSLLTSLLRARGDDALALDRAVPEGAGFSYDVTDTAALRTLFARERFDAVFHLAGLNASAPSAEMQRINVEGTRAVLRAACRAGARVVAMSSSAVYGACQDDPITEESTLAPAGFYGASKVACEALAMEEVAQGCWVCIARPFNIVGPGQRAAMLQSAVLAQLVAIERGTAPPVLKLGYLGNSRDFIDARDVAAGLVAMLENGMPGQAYNLCSGEATKARTLVEMLVQFSQKDVIIQDVKDFPGAGDIPYQRGSADKLRRASGWGSRIPLECSLRDSLDWQRRYS